MRLLFLSVGYHAYMTHVMLPAWASLSLFLFPQNIMVVREFGARRMLFNFNSFATLFDAATSPLRLQRRRLVAICMASDTRVHMFTFVRARVCTCLRIYFSGYFFQYLHFMFVE
ncbi:hypothetical protein EDD22DRAFT_865070 [Suillus occidentalis]|nr:hypothetical protein EDD22DRAFT_865070 [Suillus occidentalis]